MPDGNADGARFNVSAVELSTKNWRGLVVAGQRCLGSRQPGHRHAERRAAYVIESNLMAERHAGRVSAVFTTDADLQVWPLTASGAHSNFHQRPHSLRVD